MKSPKRLIALLTAPIILLAGCSTTEPSDPTTDSAASNSATDASKAAPTGGGTLVIGVTSEADTLYPWKATQFQAVNVMQTMYGTLTEFDADLNVVPGLAESWNVSDDGLTVTFNLRKGVKFADGSDFDSADAKFSLDGINDEANAAVSRSSLANVTAVEAPDANTIVLTLSAPDAALVANLAVINMAMLSSEDTEADLNTTPNGTGPFKFGERVASQSLTVEKNPDYWGGAALLDAVEFRVIPDETSIVSAMQAGNVQMAMFDDALVAQSAEAAGMTVKDTPQLAYHVLQFNIAATPALQDLNVRLAISCAIDRQQVLDTAALGEGEVTGPITSPAYKSDPNSRPCPTRDLDKSKQYLEAAGNPQVTFKTIVSQGEYSTSVNEAQNIQAQLAEAGITMELEILESGTYVDRWVAADFEAAVALNGGRPDPDGMYGRYFTSNGNLNKVAGYSSPELDKLFADGKQSSDAAERKQIYTEVSDILEDQAVWVWLFTSYQYTAMAPSVTGYTPMANTSVQYLRETSLA
jgi:peptide/nickel transport system substrate-binding protein